MGVRKLMVKLVGIFIVSSVFSNYLSTVSLSAKCWSFMPRKLARYVVKAKHNLMEGGVLSKLYFCASRMPSVNRSACMHIEGKTFMLWESQQHDQGTEKQGKPTIVPRIHEEWQKGITINRNNRMKERQLGSMKMGHVGRGRRMKIRWQIRKREGMVGKTDRQKWKRH